MAVKSQLEAEPCSDVIVVYQYLTCSFVRLFVCLLCDPPLDVALRCVRVCVLDTECDYEEQEPSEQQEPSGASIIIEDDGVTDGLQGCSAIKVLLRVDQSQELQHVLPSGDADAQILLRTSKRRMQRTNSNGRVSDESGSNSRVLELCGRFMSNSVLVRLQLCRRPRTRSPRSHRLRHLRHSHHRFASENRQLGRW